MTTQPQNIWIAAGDGDIERVTELLDSNVDVDIKDKFGYTPLHAAVSYNHLPLINFLLSRGADVNITDSEGDTPLYVAETVEVAQHLLSHGADASHRNGEGRTAASIAREEGWVEVAALLRDVTGEAEPEDEGEEREDYSHLEVEASADSEFVEKVDRLMKATEEDGVNRDDELRGLVARLVMGGLPKNEQERKVGDHAEILDEAGGKKE